MSEVVARKVAEISARVARVREFLPPDAATFRARRTEAEALTWNLYLALQTAMDLAMHLVAERGLGVPGSSRDAFAMLERAELIDMPPAMQLSVAVGMRNRIAHQYGTLDLDRVYAMARDEVGELEAFARAAAATL